MNVNMEISHFSNPGPLSAQVIQITESEMIYRESRGN